MSDFYNKYPYTDFHELNLDWIIERVKELTEDWISTKEAWENTEAEWQELYTYVHDYFDNLNVQSEVNTKINAMVADGSFQEIAAPIIQAKVASDLPAEVANQIDGVVAEQIDGSVASQIDEVVAEQIGDAAATATSAWLTAHVDPVGSAVVVDDTLTISGAAADAAVTGKLLNSCDVNDQNIENKMIGIQNIEPYVLTFNDNMVAYHKSYIKNDYTIDTSASNAIISIKDPTITKLTLPISSTSTRTFYTCYIKNEHTFVARFHISTTQETELDLTQYEFTEILINWFGGETASPFFDHVTCECKAERDMSAYARYTNLDNMIDVKTARFNIPDSFTVDMSKVHNLGNGYCRNTGISDSDTHKYLAIPASDIKYISVTPGTDRPAFGYVFYMHELTDATASQIIGRDGGEWYSLPRLNDGYIVINYYQGGDYASEFSCKTWPIETRNIQHLVRKPFNFAGKTAIYTGDSITVGYTSGSTTTPNNYPKLFSEKVGLNYSNKAKAGALYVAGYNTVQTVVDQVKAISSNPDIIFIAGGINDWALGSTLAELKAAVADLCTWINSNKPNCEIIFILPVNQGGWDIERNWTPLASLDEYRQTIFDTVMYYNVGKYSIVNGKLFDLPEAGDDENMISRMYGDRLHPTERGYIMYATGLMTVLE